MENSGNENKIYSDITSDDLLSEFSDIMDDDYDINIDKNTPPYICRKGCKYYETDKSNGEVKESCWLTNGRIYDGFICLIVEPKQDKSREEVLTV